MGAMTQLLAHPFRLAGSAVATVDADSDAGTAQEIAVLVATRPGERGMVPDYGIPDPAFTAGLDLGLVNTALAEFGPEGVAVSDLTAGTPDQQGRVLVTLSFGYDAEGL